MAARGSDPQGRRQEQRCDTWGTNEMTSQQRIRNIIAPTHFRIRSGELGGRKRKTPCVATGVCNDCRSKERGCNIYTIIEGKPAGVDLHVIVVNTDLGLGWDPSWPHERIAKIREEYKKFVWLPV